MLSGRFARGKPGWARLGVFVALLGTCPAAFGDPSSAPSDSARRAQAEASYDRGVEAYRAEHYSDAVRLFLDADRLLPSAALSFNIARAYEKLGDDAATLRWYRDYLRRNPNPPNAPEVRGNIDNLAHALAKKGLQQVTLLSEPPGATVSVDGQALGVTPLTTELGPGSHRVHWELRSHTDANQVLTLDPQTPMDASASLRPLPLTSSAAVTSTAPPAVTPTPSSRHFGIAPYVTFGAGVLALGGAALFEARRSSAQDAASKDRTQLAFQSDVDDMNRRQTDARIFLGVGGVLVATGVTLFVLDRPHGSQTRVSVSSSAAATGVSVRGNFQ